MAWYVGGYPQERFQYPVDKNFFCPICTDVLKDPLQCRNQHYFCQACIRKHLENSKTCPICLEKLTELDLIKPPRIVIDYLNGLVINCDYSDRGCTEVHELGSLNNHVQTCCFRPVTCPNRRCETIVNMKDLDQHKTEHCEYRRVYCQECDEEMSIKKYGKHACILSKELNEIKAVLLEVKDEVTKICKNQNKMLNEILKKFHVVPSEKADEEEHYSCNLEAHSVLSKSTGSDMDIMVLGGNNKISLQSVEMYGIVNKTWTNFAPTQECRVSSTSHYYKGYVFITGGHCNGMPLGSIEYVNVREGQWLPFACSLPVKCHGHKSVIYNDRLWVIGGMLNKQPCSNTIHEVMLNPPYKSKLKCNLLLPLAYHGVEVFGNDILILGGSTTGYHDNAVNNVLFYSIPQNKITKTQALPFPIMDMATVKYGDEVIIIGGRNEKNEILRSVLVYNYKSYKCRELPSMKHKRAECVASISGNKVYVMGGFNWEDRYLNSVECLDLVTVVWKNLPPMNEAKDKICAVAIPKL